MTRTTRRAVAAAAVTSFLTGCMPSYNIEPRMIPSTPKDEGERCYQEKRIEMVSGDASWSYTTGGYGYTVHHEHTAGGLAFYQGGERLDAREAVQRLGDPELSKAYEARLAETAGASTMYPVWRDLAFLMAGGGLALALVALGQVLAQAPEERGRGSLPPTIWIGTGLAVGSIIPTIFASTTYKGAIQHHRTERLFSEPSLTPRLEESARAFNRRAAQGCNANAEPELPMSPSIRAK